MTMPPERACRLVVFLLLLCCAERTHGKSVADPGECGRKRCGKGGDLISKQLHQPKDKKKERERKTYQKTSKQTNKQSQSRYLHDLKIIIMIIIDYSINAHCFVLKLNCSEFRLL